MIPESRNGIPVRILLLFAGVAGLLVALCSNPIAEGGGSRGGNPVVTGKVVDLNGSAARNVRVVLIAADYDPVADSARTTAYADTTDSVGTYSIEIADSGTYNVEAVGMQCGERSIRFAVDALRDSVLVLPVDTLHQPGALSLIVPGGSDTDRGYVYVPGTSISATFNSSRDTVRIDSVPRGTLPELVYVQQQSAQKSVIGHAIPVVSGETTLVVNTKWANSRRIALNTTSSGAGVTGNVYNFPVLIRLKADNFEFSNAESDGSDIMFTGKNNVRLPYEIERWDAAAQRAEIWVTIDTVSGNDSTQSIVMYWGNPSAPVRGEGAGVFDTADGFQGVWHLGDNTAGEVRDATGNQYHGTAPATLQIAEGIIGNCRTFNGTSDYITMPNTAGGKLNFPEDGNYTVSAWVSLDTFDNASHCIVSKGYEQYYLRSTYISKSIPAGTPLWEFVEFSETDKWQTSNSPAAVRQWTLLTGVRQGNRQLLYINGVLVDSTVDVWQNNVSRNTSNDLTIGKFAKAVTVPIIEGSCYFEGGIDEVRIISAVQSPNWVRLCYMNQRPDDRLVVFR